MFNRHTEEHHEMRNYQSVNVHVAPGSQQSTPLAGLAMFGMLVVLMAGLAVVVYRLIVDTVEILAGMVVALLGAVASLLSAVVALVPWLAGGAVLVALAIVALRSLPEAIEEAAALRRHYLAARQPMMLEVKDVDYSVVVLRPVRSVTTIDPEQ